MRREPQGEMQMQRRVFLARLLIQAKCGRQARMHRQRRKKKGEKMTEDERRSNRLSSRQKHSHTGLAQI